jgi:hypothetical protein
VLTGRIRTHYEAGGFAIDQDASHPRTCSPPTVVWWEKGVSITLGDRGDKAPLAICNFKVQKISSSSIEFNKLQFLWHF